MQRKAGAGRAGVKSGRAGKGRRRADKAGCRADKAGCRTGPGPGQAAVDYGVYCWTAAERLIILGKYALIDGAISALFFRSAAAFLILLPGVWLYGREAKKVKIKRRQEELCREFLSAMQFTSAALSAGYVMENALKESRREMKKLATAHGLMERELSRMASQMELSVTVEQLMLDLGRRSHAEDIRSFGEIFAAAKRTGGDLRAILRNTVSSMEQKEEARREIEAGLSGKRMEQRLMSAIPLFILAYVRLSSPGFLDVMYETILGRGIMGAALLIYGAAVLWGRRVMDISV